MGTDPNDPDTDGDGLDDDDEGKIYETDPTTADTDGDGVLDGAEITIHGTGPTNPDTDGDGLSDGQEINIYDIDPLHADTDRDNLTDGREVDIGTSPTVTDSDGDGLNDGREVKMLDTNPLSVDTDDDGLSDDRELSVGTGPGRPDTDSDGLPDGPEVTHPELKTASPLRYDVFVELDWMAGHRPDPNVTTKVEGRFFIAPISNPDGSRGVDLHVFIDEPIPTSTNTTSKDLNKLMDAHFQREDAGYFYAVAVESVEGGESIHSVKGLSNGPSDNGQFAFTTSGEVSPVAFMFMHELGHSLGLSDTDYRGIDSTEVPYESYGSVMNYNAPSYAADFNRGAPFDGWEHINETAFAPDVVRDEKE